MLQRRNQQFEASTLSYDVLIDQQQQEEAALQQLLDAYKNSVSLLVFALHNDHCMHSR